MTQMLRGRMSQKTKPNCLWTISLSGDPTEKETWLSEKS